MMLVKELLNMYFISINNNIEANEIDKIHIISENNNDLNLVFYKSNDNKYFVKYNFINLPNGKHLEFFAKYICI